MSVHKITSVKNLLKGRVYEIAFKRTFDFCAGQVLAISTDHDTPARLYSIASGVHEKEIRLLFEVVAEGKLTNKLAKLKEGDKLLVSEPFGKFTDNEEPAYWIATGTGIAPFASMFNSGLGQNKILIHGARTLKSFYYQHDFFSMGERYVRCCSKEKAEHIFDGRVTDYLSQFESFPADYKYYLCGSAEMIVETRDILLSKGVPFDKILAEIYF